MVTPIILVIFLVLQIESITMKVCQVHLKASQSLEALTLVAVRFIIVTVSPV